MEDGLVQKKDALKNAVKSVLILIVVEDGLVQKSMIDVKNEPEKS